ncbi:MAG: SRPBCC family protein [Cryomorphaceae bacterium]|nr:SRPBCC family protein [Cryomorphaceae bacterium]
MKAVKIILLVILSLIVVVSVAAFLAPTEMSVERKISINAPQSLIKNQVMYLKNFPEFSPWHDLDPEMESRIEGADGTIGAKYFWEGNEDVGKGVQEIMGIEENRIEIDVNFIEPFESVAHTFFTFQDEDGAVEVTWGFTSKLPRPFNVIALFMNMKKGISNDYDLGLEKLKTVCEAKAAKQGSGITSVVFPKTKYLSFRETIPMDEMKAFFDKHFQNIYDHISSNDQLEIVGAPCAMYYEWNEENGTTDVAASVPISGEASLEGYRIIEIEGKAFKSTHQGDYESLENAHRLLHKYFEEHNLTMSDMAMEEYVTNPEADNNPENWITHVYYFAE